MNKEKANVRPIHGTPSRSCPESCRAPSPLSVGDSKNLDFLGGPNVRNLHQDSMNEEKANARKQKPAPDEVPLIRNRPDLCYFGLDSCLKSRFYPYLNLCKPDYTFHIMFCSEMRLESRTRRCPGMPTRCAAVYPSSPP